MVAAKKKSSYNPLAVISFVLSCFSLFTGITWIGGIIFGHIALSQIKRDPTQSGKGFAIAALIIGYMIFCGIILSVLIWIFFFLLTIVGALFL